MIERIIAVSVARRWWVIACCALIALTGIYAIGRLPVDAIPDLSEDQVIVFCDWPGHNPRELDDQVTYPLSVSLQGLSGVRVVRSSSDVNYAMMSVILEDGYDYDRVREQIGERISNTAASLPSDAHAYLAPDSPATGQIYWYTLEGNDQDLGSLRAIQDSYVRIQLACVPGVAEVASVGGSPIEYQVSIDPDRLVRRGVTLDQLDRALARANGAVGGHVIQKGGAEFIVRGANWFGDGGNSAESSQRVLRDIENVVVTANQDGTVRVADLASVAVGSRPRRGVLEKDGSEVVGGVITMRHGENPLEVTRRIKETIREVQAGLPAEIRIVPMYDRTLLIEGAIGTVTDTLTHAILGASVAVLVVLVHFRTTLIVAITLPLATLISLMMLWLFRGAGLVGAQTNIMSLAGIVVSIGVLADVAIVMAENVMFNLKQRFPTQPVDGDVRSIVVSACQTVGRPIFFSVLIMLLSFLPVFALQGAEGKMFRPMALTKSLALGAAAGLAITLVPALCTLLIKGRLRGERENWLVRSVMDVYFPVLDYLLSHPAPLAWLLGVTFILGFAPLGIAGLSMAVLLTAIVVTGQLTRTTWRRAGAVISLVAIALIADQRITPLKHEFMTPLDEGTVMDMPISIPRASVIQSGDDLKMRDMILCRFPEVEMVVGKAGRAETPTDPAPLDMIETMISFRPAEFWPRRKMTPADAARQNAAVLEALIDKQLVEAPSTPEARREILESTTSTSLQRIDGLLREFAYQRNNEFRRALSRDIAQFTVERVLDRAEKFGLCKDAVKAGDAARIVTELPNSLIKRLEEAPTLEDVVTIADSTAQTASRIGLMQNSGELLANSTGIPSTLLASLYEFAGRERPTTYSRLLEDVRAFYLGRWSDHVHQLNGELIEQAAIGYTRVLIEEQIARSHSAAAGLKEAIKELQTWRLKPSSPSAKPHHGSQHSRRPLALPPGRQWQPKLDEVQNKLTAEFKAGLVLWEVERSALIGFGGELDGAVQMPGWTNVWTMPIQNRVDMLATGVNTTIGIKILGRNLEDIAAASERVAEVVKNLPGATDVVADPVRGKGYLEITVDRERAAQLGVNVGDVNDVVEVALGGRQVTTTVQQRSRHPVVMRFTRATREDEESIKALPVLAGGSLAENVDRLSKGASTTGDAEQGDDSSSLRYRHYAPLAELADIRITEGPATLKSENGLLRNYVRCNVRDRGTLDFVEEARRVIGAEVKLPEGVFLEWTGRFESEARARHTLAWIVPLVLASIVFLLYWTYRDLIDALLMLLAVPGAIAGGIFFQWLCGYAFSTTVWIGYIACFGMAAATGIIMLVYLREAVQKLGGLEKMTLDDVRQATLKGAAHRLRPKLLTEATTIIGLAPMLWASGPGAEIIRPMAAPVLGGILIADEVIDLLLPVLFYHVRRRRWFKLHRPAQQRPAYPDALSEYDTSTVSTFELVKE